MNGYDYRLEIAFDIYGGIWPKELTSGIMFYKGLRITRRKWNQYKRELTA